MENARPRYRTHSVYPKSQGGIYSLNLGQRVGAYPVRDLAKSIASNAQRFKANQMAQSIYERSSEICQILTRLPLHPELPRGRRQLNPIGLPLIISPSNPIEHPLLPRRHFSNPLSNLQFPADPRGRSC
jgi:hypothetical protein